MEFVEAKKRGECKNRHFRNTSANFKLSDDDDQNEARKSSGADEVHEKSTKEAVISQAFLLSFLDFACTLLVIVQCATVGVTHATSRIDELGIIQNKERGYRS